MDLVDMELPPADADIRARSLKYRPLTKNIPILLMSRNSKEQMQDLCAEAGADGDLIFGNFRRR